MKTNLSNKYHQLLMNEMNIPDRGVNEKECEQLTGLSRLARWRLESQNKFPKPTKVSARTNIWLLSDILEWLYESKSSNAEIE
ncbi:helix-turn-helix transcriptional regulator [Pseudoalteromonas lipolytica]|uniref:Transcriptional regulator, AlpA family n=1 Tax=Pseudoalteromonas lipolytica TaxID=570156 RepID=A0ABY1GPM1_9GAMM|nr:AlpA family phage regulatory protein [Pseudoalteromonas lipolytica]SFU00649.1 transcriptional regulator, AlpA family [Pseudoalteromonas lipolytica]